ncbi:CRM domain-containing protein [Psidium guajava]|nr:CRM domain-containing protein [Psidium guajava]
MFAATSRNLQRHSLKTLSSIFLTNHSKNAILPNSDPAKLTWRSVVQPIVNGEDHPHSLFMALNPLSGWCRSMSTKGRSMRSKVERRMRKESGKTLREIRRAKKLRKKLMTDEERLIYNLKRAKKKVALLLQKLKKYELPELPPPRHDPELLTPEQLQAFKKIGFRNKNYVPVGVRGVFGGVVQNMHLHWKFHETVQVCCDNFPKEKIKEMATMIARLSGGIVINIHNVKTIIMFRGRNYRQPKNLIPINTLTKRKALFKARFEQALESQKLNIKKIEQQLRRMGVNPEDPVAMASIQRVASTFFNAIDKKEGSPYVFHDDRQSVAESMQDVQLSAPAADSDQEELDRFIAEIEDAADKEWAAEEAAEKEEAGKIRYWNREEFGGRFKRPEYRGGNDSDIEIRGARNWKDRRGKQAIDSNEGEHDGWDSDDAEEVSDVENAHDDSDEELARSIVERQKHERTGKPKNIQTPPRNARPSVRNNVVVKESESDSMLSDLENVMWDSDEGEGEDSRQSETGTSRNYHSSSDEDENLHQPVRGDQNRFCSLRGDDDESNDDMDESDTFKMAKGKQGKYIRTGIQENNRRNAKGSRRTIEDNSAWDESVSDSDVPMRESEMDDYSLSRAGDRECRGDNEGENYVNTHEHKGGEVKKAKTQKQVDESWDSD